MLASPQFSLCHCQLIIVMLRTNSSGQGAGGCHLSEPDRAGLSQFPLSATPNDSAACCQTVLHAVRPRFPMADWF